MFAQSSGHVWPMEKEPLIWLNLSEPGNNSRSRNSRARTWPCSPSDLSLDKH